MSIPPALPITNSPHDSVSRFSRMSPLSSPAGNSLAPNIPVSSSRVISPSTGPCCRSLASITAMMVATPKPSSLPKVVRLARTQSPSMIVSIGSVSKLCLLSLAFCGTMSMWACRITPFLFSKPGVAGLRITMLPAGSRKASTPAFLAKSSKKACTFSRCPDGRGTCVSASKLRQISSGLRFLMSAII